MSTDVTDDTNAEGEEPVAPMHAETPSQELGSPESGLAEGTAAQAMESIDLAADGEEPAEASASDGGSEAGEDEAEDVDDEAVEGEVEGAQMPVVLDDVQLKGLVEALVFAAEKPVTLARLRQLTRTADVKRIDAVLASLTEDYRERGIALQCVSGGYQFRTATQFSRYVQQLVAGRPVRLTRAQLETLAIVAYRQPITRPEIDDIRGVDSSNTLRVLSDRSLVRILGKKEEVGRPLLYGTTKEFLDFFSINDLRELPTLREYSELSPESRKVMTAKLGERAEEGTVEDVAVSAEGSGEMRAADATESSESREDGEGLGGDTNHDEAEGLGGDTHTISSPDDGEGLGGDTMAGHHDHAAADGLGGDTLAGRGDPMSDDGEGLGGDTMAGAHEGDDDHGIAEGDEPGVHDDGEIGGATVAEPAGGAGDHEPEE